MTLKDPEKALKGSKVLLRVGSRRHAAEVTHIEEVGYRYFVTLAYRETVLLPIFRIPIKAREEIRCLLGMPGDWTCLSTGEIYAPPFIDKLLNNKLRLIEAQEHLSDYR